MPHRMDVMLYVRRDTLDTTHCSQRERANFGPASAPCSSLAWAFTRKWDQIFIMVVFFKLFRFFLVHGYQHPAHGVWHHKGRYRSTEIKSTSTVSDS